MIWKHIKNMLTRRRESRNWEKRFYALAEHCTKAQVQEAMQAGPTKDLDALHNFLSPDSPNFMNSGMGFQEWFMYHNIERESNSLTQQMQPERQRRLDLIVRLGYELEKIKLVDNFSTAFGEMAIEYVIAGDWKMAKDTCKMLRFDHEFSGDLDRRKDYCDLWDPFVKVLQEASHYSTPATDVPDYPDIDKMMERGGRVRRKDNPKSWIRNDIEDDENSIRFNYFRNIIDQAALNGLYEVGVRWHRPNDEPGYWYKADGDVFVEKNEQLKPHHRFYAVYPLLQWHSRNFKRSASAAPAEK